MTAETTGEFYDMIGRVSGKGSDAAAMPSRGKDNQQIALHKVQVADCMHHRKSGSFHTDRVTFVYRRQLTGNHRGAQQETDIGCINTLNADTKDSIQVSKAGRTLGGLGSGGGAIFKPQPCSTNSILRGGWNLRLIGRPSW